MKTITTLIAIIITSHSFCFAQGNSTSKKGLNNSIFEINNSKGIEVEASDIIIRSNEVDSLIVVPMSQYLKSHKPVDASIIFKIIPKANVRIIDFDQIFNKYNIDAKFKDYSLIVDNRPVKDKNIYASSDAILSVNVDEVNKKIIILSKPETKKLN